MKRFFFLSIIASAFSSLCVAQLHEHSNGNISIGTTHPDGGKLQVADGAADPIKYGSLQITRPSSADSRFHLSFIRNGMSVSGMGYQANSNLLGIWHANNNSGTPQLSFSPEQKVGIQTTIHHNRFNIGGADGNLHMGDYTFGNGYNGIWLNGSTNAVDYNLLSKASDYNLYINRPTGGHIHFRQANQNQMVLTPAGNLGIGLDGAEMKMDILTSTLNDGINLRYNNAGFVRIHSNSLGGGSWNGITQSGDGGIIYGPVPNFGFVLAPASSAVSGLRMDKDGNVGIGTAKTADVNYKLFVETGIRTRKVRVDQTNWPDYVFEHTYKLLTLEEVEQFIQNFKHLPGVPSAHKVAAEGLDLGTNQAILLQKIEELTLYIIEQHKELNDIKQENAALRKLGEKLEVLQQQMNQLQQLVNSK